ncbi:MAG: tyrosine-type recombinase/integrase [Luteolibacter sp.]
MARALSYQTTRTPDGGYRVYLGDNQYVQRKTKLAIQNVIAEHKITRQMRGRELAAVPPSLVAELLTLHQRCEAEGTSIDDAVQFWLPHYRAKSASIPLADAIANFLDHCRAKEKASATIRERAHRLDLWLRAQPEPEITVFEASDVSLLRGFLNDESERTSTSSARNVWAVISAFGTWAKNRDLLPFNPCTVIEKPDPGERPVKVMQPDEVRELLKIAVKNYNFEVLSYLVISLFAGLRPHEFVTEQPKNLGWITLNWEAILNRKKLVKEKRLGKTKKARQVPVGDTLAAWICYLQDREENELSGSVVRGYSYYQNFRRWKRTHYPDHLPAIEDDVLRHSYGTYRVLQLGEVGKVALEMGNSESTVRQHYLNGERTEEESADYWKLTPEVILKD